MNNHIHRWRLPEPSGPIALAACACGVTKRMGNSDDAAAKLAKRPRAFGRAINDMAGKTYRGSSTRGGYVYGPVERRFQR